MAFILNNIIKYYHVLNEDFADPRVKDFFLMGSPFPIVGLVLFYVYFIFKLGPKLMENRAPFNINRILVVYNGLQILGCSYLVYQYTRIVLFKYSLFCEPIDYSNTDESIFIARHVWIYFMIKVIDLIDTVFFILRKKYSQISFLHVYHHAGMCGLGWVGTKYLAGGHGLFIGFINSFVHVIMYFYYLLTAWNKKYKNNIWWKKHLTQLQIGQFLWISVHFLQILFQPDCTYPKWIVYALLPQNVLMIILFSNFYIKTYVNPQKEHDKNVEKSH